MSSSCVPSKNPCVMHDPDPSNHDLNDQGGDTDSECGSLCTCTSSSMTSIATSVATCNNHPNGRVGRLAGSSASLSQPHQQSTTVTQRSSPAAATNVVAGPTTENGNPYIVVFVPPTMLSTRDCSVQDNGPLQTAFRASLITACEFCPWVAGFVFIYYAFYWWGIGPGFTAFLFMMGSHALIRFIRARGEAGCGTPLSTVEQTNNNNGEEDNEEEEREGDQDSEESSRRDVPADAVHENPPSYEAAVIKPPPYDLYHHLTPTQPRSRSKQNLTENFLVVPELRREKATSPADDCDDDVFLPSYQDALKLSFRDEKEVEITTEPNQDS